MIKSLEYLPAFYENYVRQVPEDDVTVAFKNGGEKFIAFLESIDASKYNYRYDEEKWTVREVIQHLIDAERLFQARALRFARNDKTPLPGFDENAYVPESNVTDREFSKIILEFTNVRNSSIDLFSSFSKEMLKRYGVANGNNISVEAIGFIMAGHVIHHQNVLKTRYNL